jgi:hypothetical protein
MDYDTYSANDQIGKVCISLNPLLLSNSDKSGFATHTGKGSVMSGWLPVYDTSKFSCNQLEIRSGDLEKYSGFYAFISNWVYSAS